MTESDWWSCGRPLSILDFLREGGKLSERKARLFGVAVCRGIIHLLPDVRSQRAIEVSELLADGQADEAARSAARESALQAANAAWAPPAARENPTEGEIAMAMGSAATAAMYALDATPAEREVVRWATDAVGWMNAATRGHQGAVETGQERRNQAGLLRDIFGPLPFRAVAIPAAVLAWNDGCIPTLASGIYEERTFTAERMSVLADAMEEAGVTDEEVLGHLRGSGPHCRGCWIMDLLTGRE